MTSAARYPLLPDVPTVRELGFPNLELEGWNGLFAPAKTPKPVIQRLFKEITAVLNAPANNETFFNVGALNARLSAMQGRIEQLERELASEKARQR